MKLKGRFSMAAALAATALLANPAGAQPATSQPATSQSPSAQPPTAQSAPARAASGANGVRPVVVTVPGMPGVPDPDNLYSETVAGKLSPAVAGALERIYVPNRAANSVSVIDPATLKVVHTFKVGVHPQHITPSWDLTMLWVSNNAEGRTDGSMTPIDPKTGKPGESIPIDDPYNLYWSPDGRHAIVVAEAYKRLDFRDAKTLKLDFSIPTPDCDGINHADFSIDGRYALFTCEFGAGLTKIDLVNRKVVGTIKLSAYFDRPEVLAMLSKPGWKPRRLLDPVKPRSTVIARPAMPQDVRVSPNGKRFYVADMMSDGVHVVDFESFRQLAFIPTGVGAHGLYPSRDGKSLYVANRGSNRISGQPRGNGSVAVIDFATEKIVAVWPIPGGGSPDMGNVTADGKHLWLSGRYDNVVYRIDTTDGSVVSVKVGQEPHGLTVWPQPGRYSLGHTGNLR